MITDHVLINDGFVEVFDIKAESKSELHDDLKEAFLAAESSKAPWIRIRRLKYGNLSANDCKFAVAAIAEAAAGYNREPAEFVAELLDQMFAYDSKHRNIETMEIHSADKDREQD